MNHDPDFEDACRRPFEGACQRWRKVGTDLESQKVQYSQAFLFYFIYVTLSIPKRNQTTDNPLPPSTPTAMFGIFATWLRFDAPIVGLPVRTSAPHRSRWVPFLRWRLVGDTNSTRSVRTRNALGQDWCHRLQQIELRSRGILSRSRSYF